MALCYKLSTHYFSPTIVFAKTENILCYSEESILCLSRDRLRLVSNDCGFPWWRTVNRLPAHCGYTCRSCGTLGLAVPEVAVRPMKSAARIVSIWTRQYDSYIFSAGWLELEPMRLEVHLAGIRPARHAVKWYIASYLFKIEDLLVKTTSVQTALVH